MGSESLGPQSPIDGQPGHWGADALRHHGRRDAPHRQAVLVVDLPDGMGLVQRPGGGGAGAEASVGAVTAGGKVTSGPGAGV